MAIGLLAKKLGMTRVFNEHGRSVAVTVLQAGSCAVTQIKEPKTDGYRAVQVGFEPVTKASRVTKALQGHFKKAGTDAFRYVREFRLPNEGNAAYAIGQPLTVEVFKEGEMVDVTGTSIGKGFQGGVKRWHWKGGPATHGSTSHRAPGSIGSTTTPGRVIKGHHLPGRNFVPVANPHFTHGSAGLGGHVLHVGSHYPPRSRDSSHDCSLPRGGFRGEGTGQPAAQRSSEDPATEP